MTEEPRPPIRTCLGCGKKQTKALLRRLVLDEKNQPLLDRTHNAPGRGAYLCGPGCLQAAVKRKAFQRAFKKNVALDVNDLETAILRQTKED
ncbi:MAG TPA: YlxR family protein [Archangium sp.]